MPEDSSIRILLLGNDPGDQQWSILNYGEQLQKALAARAGPLYEVTLRFPHTRGWNRIRRSRIGRAACMYWSRYIRYPEVVRKNQADIYHFLDYGNIWVIRYLDPNQTVATCHDLIPLILSHKRKSMWPWVSARAYQQALDGLVRTRAICAVSTCTRQDLITHLGYPADRIHIVPLGIDPDLHPPLTPKAVVQARVQFKLPKGILLLHVGQNIFYKNLEGIFHCLSILCQRGGEPWLIRAGSFINSEQQKLIHRLGVANRIVELGPLPTDQLRQLYHAADILVQPSWYEGFGLPPLEAMACGVPVVVSNRGALPETVGDAALIVDPDDPTQLADAVQRIFHDPTLQNDLRKRGFIRAAQFRWETTAQKTFEVYQSILPSGDILPFRE